MLKCFSKADKNHSGELSIAEFQVAFNELKEILVIESLETVGLSVHDLVVSFIFSITLLCMIFGFIFIGIEAFSPASSFSSVTNTILPIVAGGAVNKKGGGQGGKGKIPAAKGGANAGSA